MIWKRSNKSAKLSSPHTHYDRARVAQLGPIREAIGRLGLPILSMRQLMGILNAIEVQIEVGGDSPDVNALLIDALRAALRYHVGERAAQAALRAIDTFVKREMQRWKQVEAGTLPPIELTPEEQIDELMQEGYRLMEGNQRAAACDRWLETWEHVKQLARPELRSATAFDEAHPGMQQFVTNWCSDLEMELGNEGVRMRVRQSDGDEYAIAASQLWPEDATSVNAIVLDDYRAYVANGGLPLDEDDEE